MAAAAGTAAGAWAQGLSEDQRTRGPEARSRSRSRTKTSERASMFQPEWLARSFICQQEQQEQQRSEMVTEERTHA